MLRKRYESIVFSDIYVILMSLQLFYWEVLNMSAKILKEKKGSGTFILKSRVSLDLILKRVIVAGLT